MDFLYELENICNQILPILGAITLIVLIVVLIKLAIVLGKTNKTMDEVRPSIKLVETTLDKVQAPMDTAVKVAKTIDKAHDSTLKAVDDAKDFVAKNANSIKGKVNEFINKEPIENKYRDPSPEDIIKGE